jgi:hypothetical protein
LPVQFQPRVGGYIHDTEFGYAWYRPASDTASCIDKRPIAMLPKCRRNGSPALFAGLYLNGPETPSYVHVMAPTAWDGLSAAGGLTPPWAHPFHRFSTKSAASLGVGTAALGASSTVRQRSWLWPLWEHSNLTRSSLRTRPMRSGGCPPYPFR